MNRLNLVEYNGQSTQYEYDANGNQIKMIHSNGMKSSYTFDGRNLLTGIINTSPDGTSKKYYYNYDAEGLLTEKKEPKGTTAYIYNGNKQLVSMTEPGGRETSYIYDKVGNRKSQKVQNGSDITEISYTYNSQNRLTATVEKTADSVISTAYHYDANGNQTSVVETNSAAGTTKTDSYTYDELNQLTHIEGSDGSTADYTYYATGLRASKNVNGSTAVFTYDGTKLLTEQTGNAVRTNIYGTNMIATAGADVLYYQYNNHGDVISVLDQDGTVKNEYDYDAFGNAITEKETVSNPYRYAGYYQDSESGLYYLQSRYYNPRTARFLTEDTASGKYTDPLSLNKYTYCHNQPVTGYDPDGHFLHIVAGAAIGALVSGGISYASQAIKNKSFTNGIDWKQVAGNAAEGAVTGAIGAATGGTSLAASAATNVAKTGFKAVAKNAAKKVAVNVATNIAGNTANQLISKGGKDFSIKEAAIAGASGIIDVAGDLGSDAIKKTGSKVVSKVIDTAGDKASSMAAKKAGAKATQKALESSASAGITSNGLDAVSKKVVETTSDSAALYVNKATKKLSDARIGTGYTRGGMKRATKEWREKYGPAAIRKHHLIPQQLLKNEKFVRQMEKNGVSDVKDYINKQISVISNAQHKEIHAAGWNSDWNIWVDYNEDFTLKDLQNNISTMMKKNNIPKNSRGIETY